MVEVRTGLGAVDGWLVALPLLAIGLGAVPLLIGRVQATRNALVTSLREQAAAERARQAARRKAETPVREQEAEAARVRAEERTALAREWQVAQLIAEGLANAEIGEVLFMSVATVKTHLGRLYTKLQVTNRVHLALRVRELGG